MNKYEFENTLQRCLTGKVSSTKINEIVAYYRDYIDTEIRKGKSEEEVIASLGNPKLLAKSIIQTEGIGDEAYEEYEESDETEYRQYDQNDAGEAYSKKNKKSLKDTIFYYNGKPVSRWKMYLLMAVLTLIVVCLIVVIFAAVGAIMVYLMPVLVVVGVIYLVISIASAK